MPKINWQTTKMRRRKWRSRPICHYCGERLDWPDATIDHIVPRSKGGKTTDENCVIACVGCNQKKADKLLEEFR